MTEARAQELEVRIAWLERQLLALDGVVRELGDEVVFLRKEVDRLDTERRGDTENDDDPETA